MFEKFKSLSRLPLLASVLILAGCNLVGGQNTVVPTEDSRAVRTEVAETVVAKITYEAALTSVSLPSNTPLPTNTSQPPATATVEQAASQTASTLQILPSSTPTTHSSSSGTGYYPTQTPTFYPDRAELVAQDPSDWVVLKPGEEFDLRWTVKNKGTRNWNTQFYYRYLSGPMPSDGTLYMLQNPVAIGDTAVLIVDMIAPSTPGNYTISWQLMNDDGTAFFTPYFSFSVAP